MYPVHELTQDLHYAFAQCMNTYSDLLPSFENRDYEDTTVYDILLQTKKVLNQLNIHLSELKNEYANEENGSQESEETDSSLYDSNGTEYNEGSELASYENNTFPNQEFVDENSVSHALWKKIRKAERGLHSNILYGRFKCTLCNIMTSGPIDVIGHVLGKYHQSLLCTMISKNIVSQMWAQILCKVGGLYNHILYVDFKCALCDIKIKGASSVLEHVKGKQHQSKLNDKWKYSPGPLSRKKNYLHVEGDFLRCTICNCVCPNTYINIKEHVAGKKHIEHLQNLQEYEEKVEKASKLLSVERIVRNLPEQLRKIDDYFYLENSNIHCDICDCYMQIKNIDSHLNGKKHAEFREAETELSDWEN